AYGADAIVTGAARIAPTERCLGTVYSIPFEYDVGLPFKVKGVAFADISYGLSASFYDTATLSASLNSNLPLTAGLQESETAASPVEALSMQATPRAIVVATAGFDVTVYPKILLSISLYPWVPPPDPCTGADNLDDRYYVELKGPFLEISSQFGHTSGPTDC